MILNKFKLLENEEIEKAKDDALEALTYWQNSDEKDVKKLLNHIYGLHPKNWENLPNSFLNTGNIKEISLLSRPILTIFPFDSQEIFKRFYHATPNEVNELIEEGIIYPLIQPASRYEKLDYLHPIVAKQPPDYFIRSTYFYSIFFDNTLELIKEGDIFLSESVYHLYQKAKKNDLLRKVVTHDYVNSREFYDRDNLDKSPEKIERVLENICYRYASVAMFIGEEATDSIIKNLKPFESLKVLLHIHIIFDHYFTQGLLNHMHENLKLYIRDSRKNWTFKDCLTNIFDKYCFVIKKSLKLTIIRSPSTKQIIKAHEEGVIDDYPSRALNKEILNKINDFGLEIERKILELNAKIEKIGSSKKVYKTIATIAGFSLAPIMYEINKTLGIGTFMSSFKIPSEIVEIVIDGLNKVIRQKKIRESINYIQTFWDTD